MTAAAVLVAASCSSRGEDASTSGADAAPTTETTATAAAGDFGDLAAVCGPREGGGATPAAGDATETQGLTEDTITVGTIADPGFTGRPGLNQEIFDAGTAFVEWCNAAGGINGRRIELNLHDAKLTEYTTAVNEACASDFAVVGDGAVQDNLWESTGHACGLPDFPAFAVTNAKNGNAGDDVVERGVVQAVPSTADRFLVGPWLRVAEEHPDAIDHTGILYADLDTLIEQKDKTVDGLEQVGYSFVNETSYNVLGEANWAPLAQGLADDGVRVLHFVGEPENLAQLLQAMVEIDVRPDVILQQTNFYDQNFLESAGDAAEGVLVQSAFVPFEEAADHPATEQYLDMVEAVDGKVALLGVQATSAWLLFAEAVKACDLDDDLTRSCVLEYGGQVDEWTGGGLHATTDPAGNDGAPCYLVLEVQDGAFVRSHPEEGFDCGEGDENVVEVGS
ncbi:MAG TPA: ABC transporter substrate-binding protein [Acidimicrobiales bacterium]|nr:ABC transporter substrate-binding protein [Acidimicrobiales bacterium]